MGDKVTPEWWTPPNLRDDDDEIRYKIQPLDGFTYAFILQDTVENARGHLIFGRSAIREAVRRGVVDWEGREDPFNPDQIEPSHMPGLVAAVIGASELSQADAKN